MHWEIQWSTLPMSTVQCLVSTSFPGKAQVALLSFEFYEVPITAHAGRCLIFKQQPFVMPLQPEKHGPSAVRAAFLFSTASPICWPCFLVWYFPGTDRIFTSSSVWADTRVDGTTVLKAAYSPSLPLPSPPQENNNVDSGLIPKLRSLLKKSSIKPIPKNNHLYFQVFRLYVGFLDGEESVGSWTVLPCCRLLNFLPEINEDIGSLWQQHRLLQDQLLYRYAANFQSTLKARAVGDSWMAWKFETHRNSKSLSLSLCQPNHAYTERFLNCCMIDRCRYAHFEAFPAWAGFCMYFVWNFANFHNCNICIRHTIDLCWNLLGSGQFCQKGGNSKNLEQDLWAAGISSQVLSRRVGRMFFFFFWQNWIIGDCKSQLEDPLMPILTVYLDDISHHSIVYSICTLYGWNLKGSNQAHMPLLS